MKEATQVYVSLVKQGMTVTHLDVGGGLGVNYGAGYARDEDGINYGLQEYANAVVYAVKEVCDAREVAPPVLVSESGRAITAHHSVLIVPVLGTHRPDSPLEGELPDKPHQTVKGLKKILDQLRRKNPPPEELLEAYHDAKDARNEADQLFTPRLPARWISWPPCSGCTGPCAPRCCRACAPRSSTRCPTSSLSSRSG